jgi:hypothetical protein
LDITGKQKTDVGQKAISHDPTADLTEYPWRSIARIERWSTPASLSLGSALPTVVGDDGDYHAAGQGVKPGRDRKHALSSREAKRGQGQRLTRCKAVRKKPVVAPPPVEVGATSPHAKELAAGRCFLQWLHLIGEIPSR